MPTHCQDAESIFSCRSTFTPKPVISLFKTVEPKKIKEVVYLPGEKLLISLSAQEKKHKSKVSSVENIDVERITKSMRRVLTRF